MNKFVKYFWSLALMCSAGMFVACDKGGDDPQPEPTPTEKPSITISSVAAQMESISFKLTPANADAYEYNCVPSTEFDAGSYQLTRVDNGNPSEVITFDGLTANTDYVIVARAYMGKEQGELVTKKVTTTSTPAQPAVVTISSIVPAATSVSFELSHTGDAASYFYAVYAEGETAPAQFSEIEAAAEGATAVTVENLTEETAYVIEAYGVFGEVTGEHVKGSFSTLSNTVGFSFSLQALTSQYPEEQIQFSIVCEESLADNIAEIRYVNLSQVEYLRDYKGRPENIETLLKDNISPAISTKPSALTRQRLPMFSNLSAGTSYYCFVMMIDKEGVYTSLYTQQYKTSSYDFTGTANATWTLASYEISGNLMELQLEVTPNSDCVEMWVYVVEQSIFNTTPVATLISQAKKQNNAAQWYHAGASVWTTGYATIFTTTPYVVLPICRDASGKYNNLKESAMVITIPGGGGTTEPGEGEGGGEVDPKL